MKISKLKREIILLTIILSSLFLLSFDNDKDFEITKNLDIYYTLFKELDIYYVDEINPGDLIKTSIDKMLESLDPYTNFIPESKLEDYKFMTTGQYGGVGASIRQMDNKIIISDIYEAFPAFKSGLKIGDEIIKIDNTDVEGKSSDDISELLRGQPGTKFIIGIKRPGTESPLSLSVEREKITINSVPYYGKINDNTGYIILTSFTNKCSDEVKTALKSLKEQNIKNLILDLRNNPGGLLIEAVDITNLFIDKNEEIVSTKGKFKQYDKTYSTSKEPVDSKIPVMVLVNSSSASASEIVSGALQDLDRAVIIGEKTYGKGLVQMTREISYNTKLKVTTAKYYMPSGRCIQALDYSHRNEDGSVGNVPDSLKSEFTTRAGRKVFDGGGVEPDISIDEQYLNNFMISIIKENLFFDFATWYTITHPNLENGKNFTVTASVIYDFKKFLKEKNFVYESETEKEIAKLKETIADDQFDTILYTKIEDMIFVLNESKDLLIDQNKEMIKAYLGSEIYGRYYYQKDRIEYQLKHDPLIDSAVAILNNAEQFNSILNGKSGSHKIE